MSRRKSVYFVEFFVCTGKLQILIMIYAVKVKIGGIVMTKKILITGGAGYIGSHTALELLNEGYEVVVYDNLCNSSKESLKRVIKELSGKHITFYEGDVWDETALKAMMEKEGVDAVIHFAGLKAVGESVAKPWEYYENNIAGTLTLVDVMRKHNVKNIIFSHLQLYTEIRRSSRSQKSARRDSAQTHTDGQNPCWSRF